VRMVGYLKERVRYVSVVSYCL